VGEAYQIGADAEKDNRTVLTSICDLLDQLRPRSNQKPYRDLIETVMDRPGHDRRYATNAAKFKKQTHWSAEVSFDFGMEKTIRWYLDNPKWCDSIRAKGYEGQRLGLVSK
jgi:dTDP-glucose 4,6-dehydratase